MPELQKPIILRRIEANGPKATVAVNLVLSIEEDYVSDSGDFYPFRSAVALVSTLK